MIMRLVWRFACRDQGPGPTGLAGVLNPMRDGDWPLTTYQCTRLRGHRGRHRNGRDYWT